MEKKDKKKTPQVQAGEKVEEKLLTTKEQNRRRMSRGMVEFLVGLGILGLMFIVSKTTG